MNYYLKILKETERKIRRRGGLYTGHLPAPLNSTFMNDPTSMSCTIYDYDKASKPFVVQDKRHQFYDDKHERLCLQGYDIKGFNLIELFNNALNQIDLSYFEYEKCGNVWFEKTGFNVYNHFYKYKDKFEFRIDQDIGFYVKPGNSAGIIFSDFQYDMMGAAIFTGNIVKFKKSWGFF